MKKKIKMYAVVALAKEFGIAKGDIYGAGWGTMQSWIFERKWEAEDAIEQYDLEGNYEIIPCEITYSITKRKKK